MLDADAARQAIIDILGDSIEVGNPLPFIRGYDNVSGGAAAISNFNSLMKAANTPYAITGTFGQPGLAASLSSAYPSAASSWPAISFTDNGDGTGTWTGTADGNATEITVDLAITTDNVTGTFGTDGGNDAAVTWDGNLYTGNRIDTGTNSQVNVSNATTAMLIRFDIDLNTGIWSAAALGASVVSGTGNGTSSFAPGGALDITGGTLTVSFNTVTAITGTVAGVGTITGTAQNNSGFYDIVAAELSAAGQYQNIFYGEVTFGIYDDDQGEISPSILAKYFGDLDGGSPVISAFISETLGATLDFDSRQSSSPGMAVQEVTFASRCTIFFSGYLFKLTPSNN